MQLTTLNKTQTEDISINIHRCLTKFLRLYLCALGYSTVLLTIERFKHKSTYLPQKSNFSLFSEKDISIFIDYFIDVYEYAKGSLTITNKSTEKEVYLSFDFSQNKDSIIYISPYDLNYMLNQIAISIKSNTYPNFNKNYTMCDFIYEVAMPIRGGKEIGYLTFSRFISSPQPFEVFFESHEEFEEFEKTSDFLNSADNLQVFNKCKDYNLFENPNNILSIELMLYKQFDRNHTFLKLDFIKNSLIYENNLRKSC